MVQRYSRLASVATATLVLGMLLPLPGSTTPLRSKNAVNFNPPKGQGAPAQTAGGSVRGGCQLSTQTPDPPITPLMPAMLLPSAPVADRIGLTTTATPTFFVYVPQMKAKEARFSLKDAENNDVYQTVLPIPPKGGIVSIKIPENSSLKAVGQKYIWSFGIVCASETEDFSNVVFVSGDVERTEPNDQLEKQLEGATLLKQAAILAENGIWVDTVEKLAKLRQTQPSDPTAAAEWEKLLASVGLEAIAQKPLLSMSSDQQ